MKIIKQINLVIFITLCSIGYAQTNYYLSSSMGSDSNKGHKSKPWKSLEKISKQKLKPGDTIFFKSGDTFKGHFVVNGSGNLNQPIVITSYDSGDKPILTGQLDKEQEGDFREAIYVNNNEHIVFEDLEIQNNRLKPRLDYNNAHSFGIYIHNSSNKVMHNFIFRRMTFRNVYSLVYVDPSNQNAFNQFEVAAIRFFSDWDKAHIDNVLVEDCYFTDLQRFGIHIKHAQGKKGKDHRHTNLIFRRNEFSKIGGTCILPSRTRNCLIEYNIFDQSGAKTNDRMIGRGSAVWNYYSVNTVIQYNQCIGIRGILDSHGIHVDHHNKDTVVQYNYMEDCEGGFVEILGDNERATYRFNISKNDGWRQNPNWKNSNHTIWLNNKINGKGGHESNNSFIYNNTIILDRKDYPFQTAIDINALNTRIFNNIFYAVNGSGIGTKQMILKDSLSAVKNNFFLGEISKRFMDRDDHKLLGKPSSGSVNDNDVNDLPNTINSGTPYIGEFAHPRFPVEASFVFSSVEEIPTKDFFNQPIDENYSPNIGANNSKNGALYFEGIGVHVLNPIASGLIILGGVEDTYDYKLLDILGKVKQEGRISKQHPNVAIAALKHGVYEMILERNSKKISIKLLIT